jgi:hypothetical protein
MSAMPTTIGRLAAFFAALIFANVCAAHNEWAFDLFWTDDDASMTAEALSQLAARQQNPQARSVVERALVWNTAAPLVGCFFGGSAQVKARVVTSAGEIVSRAGIDLRFDFGSAPEYHACQPNPELGQAEDVRVAVSDKCCGALIGRMSHSRKFVEQPSVYLSEDSTVAEIQHEFMHVLGAHHEHQSPAADCASEFDVAKFAAAYKLSVEQATKNLRRLNVDSRRYSWSLVYDNKSIMKYYFKPEFLKNGVKSPCYSSLGENDSLTETDIEGLQKAYPKEEDVEEYKARTRSALESLDMEGASPLLREIIEQIRKEVEQ